MSDLSTFQLVIEGRTSGEALSLADETIFPLLRRCGIPFSVIAGYNGNGRSWDWNSRTIVTISTGSEKDGRDLRRILKEDPDIWFYRDGSTFHCAPISMKPVPKRRNAVLYKALMEASEGTDICENTVRIVHNKLLENGFENTWRDADPFDLLEVKGLGPKGVGLVLLARGEDPDQIAKEDYREPDIPCAMEEALSWEDGRYEEFSRLRGEVIKGSHHPELMDILVDFAFDMGCEWAARTGKEHDEL